jgi:hypothetical protein
MESKLPFDPLAVAMGLPPRMHFELPTRLLRKSYPTCFSMGSSSIVFHSYSTPGAVVEDRPFHSATSLAMVSKPSDLELLLRLSIHCLALLLRLSIRCLALGAEPPSSHELSRRFGISTQAQARTLIRQLALWKRAHVEVQFAHDTGFAAQVWL